VPLLTGYAFEAVADGRIIQLPGLPDFNGSDNSFRITQFDGWFDGLEPDAVWVANGGGPGAVGAGPWQAKERAGVIAGRILADRERQETMRRLLLSAIPIGNIEVPIVCLGNGLADDLQIFVRRSGKPDISIQSTLTFSFPLIALDPLKYGRDSLTGAMGVWTGEDWYEPMVEAPAGVWSMQLAPSWYTQMVQDVPVGPYPVSLSLNSPGDVSSQRVTATIVGPLTAGDWYLWSETTGRRLWAELAVAEGQTLILDSFAKSATLSGTDVTYLTYGDWLTLEPGPNSFRLVAGEDSEAFCQLSALPAYE
jgi:hypothetical protein